jgi:glycosyltransferase involved in cell wall biosynthesis
MNQSPKISVIIPFYNRIDWTHEAVESVLNQTLQDFEIILVDDGSVEDYRESYGLPDKRIKLLRQENLGPASARNLGIKVASGEYIGFLDSDDLFVPDKLKIQYEQMLAKGAVISHTSYTEISSNKEPIRVIHSGLFSGRLYPRIITECPIATPTVIARRDIIIQFMFLETLRVAEDSILWAQIAKDNDIHGIDIPLAKVRIHGANAAFDNDAQLDAIENRLEVLVRQEKSLSFANRRKIESQLYLDMVHFLRIKRSYSLSLTYLFLSFFAWPLNSQIYRRILKRVGLYQGEKQK